MNHKRAKNTLTMKIKIKITYKGALIVVNLVIWYLSKK